MLTYGLVNTSVVVAGNDADNTHRGDFVTYVGTGASGDTGFQSATTAGLTYLTDFSASTNASLVKITANQAISGATSAFALRDDGATITIASGQTLTLGNPGAGNSSATATTGPQTGVILNGGTISGPGTLALGQSEATIYTSDAGGTIGAQITGAGSGNRGTGSVNNNYLMSLTKFGNGTLYLTNTTSTYSGATIINQGALDVGTISSNALPTTTALIFGGGVLQGNGSFIRSLGQTANKVTWNGINGYYSQASGGFAARGGDLIVAIGGLASPTALTWGGYGAGDSNVNFITDNGNTSGILMFGSTTSDSQVDFRNAIDLGAASEPVSNNAGVAVDASLPSPLYYRIVNVAQGTGTDSAKISGAISSTVAHGLIKDGLGVLVLTGANTYTGDTVVSKGTLIIDGNQSAATGVLIVNSGATLGGSGTIGGAVMASAGSFLKPGNSSKGVLTVNGPLTLGGNVEMEISTGTRGVNYDGVNIGAGQLLTYGGTLTLTLTTAVADGTYDLFSFTGGSKAGSFDSIAFGGGYYSGTFSQVGDLWTSSVSYGQTFVFDQATGILAVGAPEPETWVLFAFGLIVVATIHRRRHVKSPCDAR